MSNAAAAPDVSSSGDGSRFDQLCVSKAKAGEPRPAERPN